MAGISHKATGVAGVIPVGSHIGKDTYDFDGFWSELDANIRLKPFPATTIVSFFKPLPSNWAGPPSART